MIPSSSGLFVNHRESLRSGRGGSRGIIIQYRSHEPRGGGGGCSMIGEVVVWAKELQDLSFSSVLKGTKHVTRSPRCQYRDEPGRDMDQGLYAVRSIEARLLGL